MNFIIVLHIFTFVCCGVYAQTTSPDLREELIKKSDELQVRANMVIAELKIQKREHLAALLSQHSWNVKMVSNELKMSSPDHVRLAVLEAQLIQLEYNVNKEISILQREASSQDVLLANAQTLKKWIQQEIKTLETQNNEHAHQAVLTLQSELNTLNKLVEDLTKAQDIRDIESAEVHIRLIEHRIYETLRHLDFNPNGSTPSPHTTIRASTLYEKTKATTKSAHVSPTPNPTQLKAELIKKATELENYANSEIAKLKKENKTTLAKGLQSLELEVKEVAVKLQKATATEILELIESELFWLERRLAIETEALVQQEKRIEKLLAIALALKTRIDSSIQLLAKTPVGKALEAEAKALEKLSNNLKVAKDEKTIINMEIELATIEKRVDDELRPIGVPTTKKF